MGSVDELRAIVQTIDSQYGKEYNFYDYHIRHRSMWDSSTIYCYEEILKVCVGQSNLLW